MSRSRGSLPLRLRARCGNCSPLTKGEHDLSSCTCGDPLLVDAITGQRTYTDVIRNDGAEVTAHRRWTRRRQRQHLSGLVGRLDEEAIADADALADVPFDDEEGRVW